MRKRWCETQEARDFIATGSSRETSSEIMETIAFFADDIIEAERLWRGDGFGQVCTLTDFWEHVTGNGRHDPEEFVWGVAGTAWWEQLRVST